MRSSLRSAARFAIAISLAGSALICSAHAAEPSTKSARDAAAMRVQVFGEAQKTPLIDTVLPLSDENESVASSSSAAPYVKSISRDGQGRVSKTLGVVRDGAFVKVSRGKEADEYVITVETRSVKMNSVSIPFPAVGQDPREPSAEELANADSAWEASEQDFAEAAGLTERAEPRFETMGAGAPEEQTMRLDLPTTHIRASSFSARLKAGDSKRDTINFGDERLRVKATLIQRS